MNERRTRIYPFKVHAQSRLTNVKEGGTMSSECQWRGFQGRERRLAVW